MTTSERWGGFSDEIPPAGDEDPLTHWIKVVVVSLFVILTCIVIGALR